MAEHVVDQLKSGDLRFAAEDPDSPENFPRVLAIWRANLLGSSGKGNEYFLKHLLGTDSSLRAGEASESQRPREVEWHDDAPEGKLDLLLTLDFRQTSTTIFSDVVLPAATWYEKHDLNTTDMHPFIHSFNPAIAPPWQTRTDWDAWQTIATKFSELAAGRLDTRTDVVAVPLLHDTPDAMANPHGVVRDWKHGECEPVPGVTMPKIVEVERDYTAVGAQMQALGPLLEKLGTTTKGVTYDVTAAVDYLLHKNGPVRGGAADGRPSLVRDIHACEAILALSGHHQRAPRHPGLQDPGEADRHPAARPRGRARGQADHLRRHGRRAGAGDHLAGVVRVGDRRAPLLAVHDQRRAAQALAHADRAPALLPRPRLDDRARRGAARLPATAQHGGAVQRARHRVDGRAGGVTVRYLTPHNKWSIHSEYQDNLFMLSLSRGGQTIWMSDKDAAKVGVEDNDWIEAVNRNGVVVARAIVSHRMPEGTVYMHHAQDRLIDVPIAETSGKRGGIHNSLTRILVKPSHVIGGYAQLSFAFNYLGPTGNQRDEVTVIRKRSQEVTY